MLQEGTFKLVSYFEVSMFDYQWVMLEGKLKKFELVDDCPVRNVLDRIGDKWSILVITILGEQGTLRFNEINGIIGTISQKMLTVTLKSLEADGLITRKIYPVVPPRVEYTLTKRGTSLLPAMTGLIDWALIHMPDILASREQYQNKGAASA